MLCIVLQLRSRIDAVVALLLQLSPPSRRILLQDVVEHVCVKALGVVMASSSAVPDDVTLRSVLPLQWPAMDARDDAATLTQDGTVAGPADVVACLRDVMM